MTALIGGSLLLIVAAAILLVVGWTSADQTLIWTSIVASVVAGILLSLGYYRSKSEAAAARPEPEPEPEPVPRPEPARRAEPQPTQQSPLVGSGDEKDHVMAYPDRSRFHRLHCRYATLPGGEKIARDTAVRRGYDPCGVCKP